MKAILETLPLIVWAACPPLFIYSLLRRIERLQVTTALLFLLLLIDVFLGLNTPNPDNVIFVQITAP